MRRLFLKIFLWYWLATAVVVLVLVASTWSAASEQGRPLWLRDIGNLLSIYGTTAASVYERDGQGALAAYIAQMEPDATIRTYFFDAQGQELSGRGASERIREYATAAGRSGETESSQEEGSLFVARAVASPGGNRY